jgi:hypothetical protein
MWVFDGACLLALDRQDDTVELSVEDSEGPWWARTAHA